jgi:hypothetical protein
MDTHKERNNNYSLDTTRRKGHSEVMRLKGNYKGMEERNFEGNTMVDNYGQLGIKHM